MKRVSFILLLTATTMVMGSSLPVRDFTGSIVYNITYDMGEIDPQAASFLPKTMKMTIKSPMSKSEISMGMGNTISIFNSDDRTGVNLMDLMGQKFAIRVSAEDTDKELEKVGEVEVVNLDETKEILGYTCKKAIVKVKDSGQDLTVFYTDELSTGLENTSNPIFKDIDGLMLEFSLEQNGINMHFTAVNIDKKKVSDNEFEIPEGYEEVTQEEFQKRFGM